MCRIIIIVCIINIQIEHYQLMFSALQLKNMINALYSSQRGGTKSFEMDGITFGWQTIIDMYKREVERRRTGAARMVPRLRESYVLRDAWTKLNVAPAKVMQVSDIIEFYYI